MILNVKFELGDKVSDIRKGDNELNETIPLSSTASTALLLYLRNLVSLDAQFVHFNCDCKQVIVAFRHAFSFLPRGAPDVHPVSAHENSVGIGILLDSSA